jgi:hypothetical protein
MVYFQTKIAIWVNFLGTLVRKCLIYLMDIWNILWTLVKFYDLFVQFVETLYILCSFGTFFPVLVSRTKKDLAALRVGE